MVASERTLLLYGGVALGAFLLFPKLAGWLAAQSVGAAGSLVREVGTGVVIGIGETIGIPPTDAEKCQTYLAAGDYWNSSFFCPAGTFLKTAAGDVIDTVSGAVVGKSEPTGIPDVIRYYEYEDMGASAGAGALSFSDAFSQWQAETGGVIPFGLPNQEEAVYAWARGKGIAVTPR